MDFSRVSHLTSEQKKGLAIVAIGAIAIGFFYIFLAHGRVTSAHAVNVSPSPRHIIQSVRPQPSITPMVVVDVAGKVVHPGVYSLPSGARAIDAIKMAGGAKPGVDLTNINLAQTVIDGEQIIVGQENYAAPANIAQGRRSNSKASGPVRINSASASQLDSLPGIGPVMAQRIIDYRTKNGPFASINDLRKVSGMGKAKFEEIKPLIHL